MPQFPNSVPAVLKLKHSCGPAEEVAPAEVEILSR